MAKNGKWTFFPQIWTKKREKVFFVGSLPRKLTLEESCDMLFDSKLELFPKK
jgi:hypothetical protein